MGKSAVPKGVKKVKPYPVIKSNKVHGTTGVMKFRNNSVFAKRRNKKRRKKIKT